MQRTSRGDCKAPEIVQGEAIRGRRSVPAGSCPGKASHGRRVRPAATRRRLPRAHFPAVDGSASVRLASWRGRRQDGARFVGPGRVSARSWADDGREAAGRSPRRSPKPSYRGRGGSEQAKPKERHRTTFASSSASLRALRETVISEDARRRPTTIGPSWNTDQGVRRACECHGGRKPQHEAKAKADGQAVLDRPPPSPAAPLHGPGQDGRAPLVHARPYRRPGAGSACGGR